MMLLVSGLTGVGLYVAHRSVAADARRNLQKDFQAQLFALHDMQQLWHTALVERCRLLVASPRLHAALEDNAIDLLYPTARDELRGLMQGSEAASDQPNRVVHARFYRFLNRSGAVLPPPEGAGAGDLKGEIEGGLSLSPLPVTPQTGYLPHGSGSGVDPVDEIMTIPIFSSETGDVISALVVGFKPLQTSASRGNFNMKSGIWVDGTLSLPAVPASAHASIASAITSAMAASDSSEGNVRTSINGVPHLLLYKRINPESVSRPGYEICVYPLTEYEARQHRLLWQVGGAGALLLLAGLTASHFLARRLAAPVERLAVDSAQNRRERQRAEAALESTSEELERTARYSADASHQLKSPVTVLRAGLESLLGRDEFKPEVYDELSGLIHQTYRLTGVIDDLLLLSRMDAGHLRIRSSPINLSELMEEWLEDLSAMPDAVDLQIEKEVPPDLYIEGERRYTSLIVQNLLENARKYNRPGGRIRIRASSQGDGITLSIGNTGHSISPEAQATLFMRFQRGSAGETVAGHGLGLNLARELARLHGGGVRLVESRHDWTEFEIRFRAVRSVREVPETPKI
jgi:signal transduction histidine kinase